MGDTVATAARSTYTKEAKRKKEMIDKNANARSVIIKIAAKKPKILPVLGKVKSTFKTLTYPRVPKTALTKFLKKRKFQF